MKHSGIVLGRTITRAVGVTDGMSIYEQTHFLLAILVPRNCTSVTPTSPALRYFLSAPGVRQERAKCRRMSLYSGKMTVDLSSF